MAADRHTFTVALTGGIGSGKSAVAERFAALGAEVVDTDAIAHGLTGPGGAAMDAIATAFGASFRTADGSLDRARMRNHVFAHPNERRRLESILHPMIRTEADARRAASRAPYVVMVIPLLVESSDPRGRFDRILVVDCEPATQVARVMARSGLSPEAIHQILAVQASRAERLSVADDVILNDGPLSRLDSAVAALHARYLAAAHALPV